MGNFQRSGDYRNQGLGCQKFVKLEMAVLRTEMNKSPAYSAWLQLFSVCDSAAHRSFNQPTAMCLSCAWHHADVR